MVDMLEAHQSCWMCNPSEHSKDSLSACESCSAALDHYVTTEPVPEKKSFEYYIENEICVNCHKDAATNRTSLCLKCESEILG